MSVTSVTVWVLGVALVSGCAARPEVEPATPAVAPSPTTMPDKTCLYEGRLYTEGARFTQGDTTYICERDSQGKLHWMVQPSTLVF